MRFISIIIIIINNVLIALSSLSKALPAPAYVPALRGLHWERETKGAESNSGLLHRPERDTSTWAKCCWLALGREA